MVSLCVNGGLCMLLVVVFGYWLSVCVIVWGCVGSVWFGLFICSSLFRTYSLYLSGGISNLELQ